MFLSSQLHKQKCPFLLQLINPPYPYFLELTSICLKLCKLFFASYHSCYLFTLASMNPWGLTYCMHLIICFRQKRRMSSLQLANSLRQFSNTYPLITYPLIYTCLALLAISDNTIVYAKVMELERSKCQFDSRLD